MRIIHSSLDVQGIGFKRDGVGARSAALPGGVAVKVRPSVRAMSRLFALNLRSLRFRGLGVTFQSSYLEAWAQRFPTALLRLKLVDGWVGDLPVFRLLGDHMLFEFQRVRWRP